MQALLLAAVMALAPGAPGTLDRSFGGDGRVETRVPGGPPAVAGVQVLAGGRPLVVGSVGNRRVVALRYRRDGRLDRRYGDRGVVSIDLGAEVTVGAVLFMRERGVHRGRMLVAGGLGPERHPDREGFIARVSRDGTLDRRFGQGGIVRTDFGGTAGDIVTDLTLDRAGRIVAAVRVDHGGEWPPPTEPMRSFGDMAVARYGSSGRLDRSFGEGGIASFPAGAARSFTPAAVAMQGDRVLIGATHTWDKGPSAFVQRLLADGSQDTAFARGGSQFIEEEGTMASDLALDPVSGVIAVAGTTYRGTRVFLHAKVPSPAPVTTVPFAEGDAWAAALTIDRRRRRLVGGSLWTPDPGVSAFGIARLRSGGKIDDCFGRGGLARIVFRRGPSTLAALDLDGRGRIVAAGPGELAFQPYADPSTETAPVFQLVRLHGGRCPRR